MEPVCALLRKNAMKRNSQTIVVSVFISLLLFISTLFFFTGCSGGIIDGVLGGTKVGPLSSEYFNRLDYESAVKEVQAYFRSFEGCTMTQIDYVGDEVVDMEAKKRGLNPNQIIILTSIITTGDDFDTTDDADRENGMKTEPEHALEPNQTYEDYLWILTRSTYVDYWEVAEHGIE